MSRGRYQYFHKATRKQDECKISFILKHWHLMLGQTNIFSFDILWSRYSFGSYKKKRIVILHIIQGGKKVPGQLNILQINADRATILGIKL